jgi:hypothetical protein
VSRGIIYGLYGREGIRYVGKTQRVLAVRYAQHLSMARHGRVTHLYNWWRSLPEAPVIQVLETCSVELLSERECAWIAKLRADGVALCNHTEGGQGGVPTPELRQRLRQLAAGRSADPAYRAKLSEANRRRWSNPNERAKASRSATERFGRQDYREKMSAAIQLRFSDPVQRGAVALTTKASWDRYTPEERAARCQAMRDGWARRKAQAA